MTRQRKYMHFVLSIMLGLSAQVSAAAYFVTGRIFTSSGLSGTASSHTSYSKAAFYRFNINGQEAAYPDGVTITTVIEGAAGNTRAARYAAFNVGTEFGLLGSPEALGQTMVAVCETRKGQFGWNGPSYVYFSKRINPGGGATTFYDGMQQEIPSPQTLAVLETSVTLQWPNLSDPTGILSSYSVYRATYLPPSSSGSYSKNELLPGTALPAPMVTFVDNGVLPNTTYYYTIAPNLVWVGGGGDSDLGANGDDKDYYTTYGQSLTMTVMTSSGTLTPSPTETLTPSSSPTHSLTPTSSPTPMDTSTATLTLTQTPSPSPSATQTETQTATEIATLSFTPTPSGTPSPAPPTLSPTPALPTPQPTVAGGPAIQLIGKGHLHNGQPVMFKIDAGLLAGGGSVQVIMGHVVIADLTRNLGAGGILTWDRFDRDGRQAASGDYQIVLTDRNGKNYRCVFFLLH